MRLRLIVAAGVGLSACSGGWGMGPAAGPEVTETTTAPTTTPTTTAPTNSAASPATTPPSRADRTTTDEQSASVPAATTPTSKAANEPATKEPVLAATPGISTLMWESAVDPRRVNMTDGQPTFSQDALTGRIQSYVAVDTELAPEAVSAECRNVVEQGRDNGGLGITEGRCLYVQVAFDVADTLADDQQASVLPLAYVGLDGVQAEAIYLDGEAAYGGTVDNVALFVFGNVVPGGVLRLELNGGGDRVTIKLDVPELQPAYFG